MGNRISIVIADDHAVLRESLAALLQSQPDFDVVGAAANGEEALRLVQDHHPQVLLLDLFMPQSDGFEVLRTLDRAGDRVASVVLTGSESQNDYVHVVRLGARGLVLKGDDPRNCLPPSAPSPKASLPSPTKLPAAYWNPWFPIQPPVPASHGAAFGARAADFRHGRARHEES